MDTVENTQLRNAMDFREALCYGIEQQKFLLRCNIEMDNDASDETAAEDEYTNM